ncbi:MAG: hypothetical protein KF802_14775 [Bdellovibrionaceae bacterium]|nr:hypothetical protein [Pseudobdellovibrionaceae bacterium]
MRKILILSLALSACASNPNKAEKLDTQVELAAPVATDQVIGVKDGNMIVQKKVLMSEELRRLQNETYEVEAKVYGGHRYFDNRGLYGVLEDCMMTKRLPMPEKREYVVPEAETTKLGLDENNHLVGVSEEFLKDRIERFATYRKVLRDRAQEYESKIKLCEMDRVVRNGQ